MRLKSYVFGLIFVALIVSAGHSQDHIFYDGGPLYNDVLFEETFTKGQGPTTDTRTITVGPDLMSTVRIFLRNGGSDPIQAVSNGAVLLNDQVIFGSNDFRVEDGDLLPVVTKELNLIVGDNNLVVELKGGGTGVINILILRPKALPLDAIYVAPPAVGGDDTAMCGQLSSPCETITQGILQASSLSLSQVIVANGVYLENITLKPGINLRGGYSSDFTTRNLLSTSTVINGSSSSDPTILAANINVATLFEGFIVQGPLATAAAANSIAISIKNSNDSFEVRNNVILSGIAGKGQDGNSEGDGEDGTDGGLGVDAFTGSITFLGGLGGSGAASGGDGGNSAAPTAGVQNGSGADGQTSAGGLGGAGGYNGELVVQFTDCVLFTNSLDAAGSNGGNGGSGTLGAGGRGGIAMNSEVVSGNWHTESGTDGQPGTNGSGGGGGGAGGGGQLIDSLCGNDDITGPSGGGGGGAGAGGSEGSGGQGGGASFGIFVFTTTLPPIIADNLIFLGRAGDGGDGGIGGVGGSGGQGGIGGQCSPLFGCGDAGDGGNGGDGGHGGGGGGGAGGDSVGIFSNIAGDYATGNTFDTSTGIAGTGGNGGISLGNNGENGESGTVSAIIE